MKRLVPILALLASLATATGGIVLLGGKPVLIGGGVWSGVEEVAGGTGPLVQQFLQSAFTNVSGVVADISTYSNDGYPTGGVTKVLATNTITEHAAFSAGAITSTVSQTPYAYQFWAITNSGPWEFHEDINGTQTIDGLSRSFQLNRYATNSVDWGGSLAGSMGGCWVYDSHIAQGTNQWSTWTNRGASAYDYANRGIWSNTLFVGNFEYDYVGDTSFVTTNHGTKGAGATAPTFAGDGTNGYYSFDGGDHILIDNVLDIVPTQGFAISYWFKVVAGTGSDQFGPGKDNNGAVDRFYSRFETYAAGANLMWQWEQNDVGGLHTLTSSGNWETNEWMHRVDQWTTNYGTEIFIDGSLDASNSAATTLLAPGNLDSLHVGKYRGGGLFFNGCIDELRITLPLTASQIAAAYAESTGRHPNP